MKKVLSMLIMLSCLIAGTESCTTPEESTGNLAGFVDPFIGTRGMGHTFPGACVPFGIVQLSPDTDTIPHNIDGVYQKDAYRYCSGYQYNDKTIVGFSHTHFSGTGHSDLGDILLMPATGEIRYNPGTAEEPEKGYRSTFSHSSEKASPGYYEVMLDRYGIKAQLTATQRTGIHKYTFPHGEPGHLMVDLSHGIYNYDGKVLWASMRVENDTLVTGYRITDGWARTNYTYFAMSFSKPVREYGYKDMEKPKYNGFWRRFDVERNFPEMAGRKVVAWFGFDTCEDPEMEVRVALSAVSTEGALKNLEAETEGRSFEELAEAAEKAWNDEFSQFEIEGTDDQKTMFYTALYHTMINPSVYMDVDGNYRGLDNNIHKAEGFTNYTVFSLWDTYRAEHPFLNLFKPEYNTDMVRSMVAHQQQSVHGMLPVWSHMANENWCMSGYHAVSVLSDALAKGRMEFTGELAEAMLRTSTVPYYGGLGEYMEYGYVPYDRQADAASATLEYAYDDWTIYKAFHDAGDTARAEEYRQRALNYRNVFDSASGFARPRMKDGTFKQDFDPLQTYGEGFIEGNSWNFSFHVPHDVCGMMALMGGPEVFESRLDSLFVMHLPEEFYSMNEDITESCLLGGYVHGNEPSHHVPYLYAWTSSPWKTQYWIREILNRMYRNDREGLGGNDDCGQMSAWYIFSALGFYPVCPGTDQYVLGAPYLPYAKIRLPNGRTLEIEASGASDVNRYVKSFKINGKPYGKTYVTFKQIMVGGIWEFEMAPSPVKDRILKADDRPYSLTQGDIPAQALWSSYDAGRIIFEDNATGTAGSEIYGEIIPDPEAYIAEQAITVLSTLYDSPLDSITKVREIHYTLEDIDGISAKSGRPGGYVDIFYSTRHIENSFRDNDTSRLLFETRGVLLHELTHAYQLEPQGVGTYGTNRTFRAFIEGMADAVRVTNGGFGPEARPKGGSYMDGYRTTGYFLVWIKDHKDPEFLRKFNRSALEVVPWSFDGAIKHILGEEYDIDSLWQEYQTAITLQSTDLF